MTALVWFKRDLRITDHQPLYQAAKQGAVLPAYIIEPDYYQQPDVSIRHWQFVAPALVELDKRLRELGQPLVVVKGPASKVLRQLCQRFHITAVYSHEETGNLWTYQRDIAVQQQLAELNIPWHQYRQFAVFRPLPNRDHWFERADSWLKSSLCPEVTQLPFLADTRWDLTELAPVKARDLPLCAEVQHAKHEDEIWQSFIAMRSVNYQRHISLPAKAVTSCSRLSPFISYGLVSLRQLQQQTYIQSKQASSQQQQRGLQAFFSRLRWHCHFMQKLEDEPAIEFYNMHPGFDGLREHEFNNDYFTAWKSGNTGYPLIDAAMRCLLATGWLHFRARAMLVAFACYHLWLHWRPVALHLAQCFVDYEPGIHYPQVQMQAGTTGINPNRMYNPVKQSQLKDTDGQFIRQWLPELRHVPITWLHTPWLMPLALQQRYGCIIGRDYPAPLIDLQYAQQQAKAKLSYWLAQHKTDWSKQKQAVFQRHASRKRPISKRNTNNHNQLKFDW